MVERKKKGKDLKSRSRRSSFLRSMWDVMRGGADDMRNGGTDDMRNDSIFVVFH